MFFRRNCMPIRRVLLVLLLLVGFINPTDVEAGYFGDRKKAIEVAAAWDKYIYSWGDNFIPNQKRWVAIRSVMKKRGQMGFFWDLPGSNDRDFNGPRKRLSLYHLDRKFQAYPKTDRRYKFIPVWEWTKNNKDFGFYFIQCKSGYFVQQSGGKGSQLWLNMGPITERSFHWKIKNVGKNRFIFKNRKSRLVIDAAGGNGGKDNVKLISWNEHGKAGQIWEMILIAEGREVGSFGKLLKARANWAARESVKQAKRNAILKKAINAVEINAGWDRYIHSWGDKFIPNENRWVAIRNTKKKKGQMGFFWDVPGDRPHQINGPKKILQTWEMPRKFQAYPKLDRRFKFIPVWTKNRQNGDFGYYYIMSGTKYFAKFESKHKNARLILDAPRGRAFDGKHYPKNHAYHWKIKNIGKNKFTIQNRLSRYVIDGSGGDAGKNGVPLIAWNNHKQANQIWEFILIAQGREVKTTGQIAKKRAQEIVAATKRFTQMAFRKAAAIISKGLSGSIGRVKDIFQKGLIEMRYDQRHKRFFLRVGFDNPLDPLMNLKQDFIDEFAKIELKKFKLDITKTDIKISLINTIASMGHHVDLIITFSGKWSIDLDGFRVHDLKMSRFTIPFFPNSVTKGIRNTVSHAIRGLKINVGNYPGKELLRNIFKKKRNVKRGQKPGIIIENVEKTNTKFLIKMRYADDAKGFFKVEQSHIERKQRDKRKEKRKKRRKNKDNQEI